MLCERCQKRNATIHLTEIVKSVKSEVHLCEKCAREIGLNAKLSDFSLSVPDMLSFFNVEDVKNFHNSSICASCGLTFMEYKRHGKVGCTDCYTYLKKGLEKLILAYHGATTHVGKNPVHFVDDREEELEFFYEHEDESIIMLQEKLNGAIAEERYEDAAIIRDKIREKERILKE
jgi:protein arginine kinase activator